MFEKNFQVSKKVTSVITVSSSALVAVETQNRFNCRVYDFEFFWYGMGRPLNTLACVSKHQIFISLTGKHLSKM